MAAVQFMMFIPGPASAAIMTVKWNVALWPGCKVPARQVTALSRSVQPAGSDVTVTAGLMGSRTMVSTAADPRLVTVMLYLKVPPGRPDDHRAV